MKQRNALESGFCTALRCRVFVKNGDGNQFVDKKNEIQRYCWRCWLRYCASWNEIQIPPSVKEQAQTVT